MLLVSSVVAELPASEINQGKRETFLLTLKSALALADVVVGNDEYANFTEAYKTSTRTYQYYKPIPDQKLAVVVSTFEN